jgi:hypothetical protein
MSSNPSYRKVKKLQFEEALSRDENKFNELLNGAELMEESLHKEIDFLKAIAAKNKNKLSPNRNNGFQFEPKRSVLLDRPSFLSLSSTKNVTKMNKLNVSVLKIKKDESLTFNQNNTFTPDPSKEKKNEKQFSFLNIHQVDKNKNDTKFEEQKQGE